MELFTIKENYYQKLNSIAKDLASKLIENKDITEKILLIINELYNSVNLEKSFNNENFRSAYHNPITSELEFFVARILFHYSNQNSLKWKIFLRCQSKGKDGKMHVPDIRIEKNYKTITIVEIKAKAGWIQPFFSKEKTLKDYKKFKEGKSDYNPYKHITQIKDRLKNYAYNFDMDYNKFFVLLPSLILVSRKNDSMKIADYKNDFSKNSELSTSNLILLSYNQSLDLSFKSIKKEELMPSCEFEDFIKKIN